MRFNESSKLILSELISKLIRIATDLLPLYRILGLYPVQWIRTPDGSDRYLPAKSAT